MVNMYALPSSDMRERLARLYNPLEIGYNGSIRHPAIAESASIGRKGRGPAEIDIVGYPSTGT